MVDISLSFNTSLCLNYSLQAEALFSLVLGPEEGKETQETVSRQYK